MSDTMRGTTKARLNITPRQLSWAMQMRIITYHFCMVLDKVLRRMRKKVYHLEEAAIGGHAEARHNLGCHEENNGRMERAVKHFTIAANMGDDKSMKALWKCHAKGFVKKDDLTVTLRAHQAAVDATKSPQREEAEEFRKRSQE